MKRAFASGGDTVGSADAAAVGWAPLPTLAVGWACFAQVLSFRGVAIWVVGGSLLVLFAMRALLSAGWAVFGLASGVTLTLGLAFLADAFGGTTSGPLARATLLSCGLTAASVALVFTRYRLLMMAPSIALLGSAFGLGAAGRSGVWVGLWAVAAAVTAAMLGPYRERDLAARARLVPLALLISCSGFVAIIALVIAAPMLGSPWTIPGAGGGSATTADPATQVAAEPPPVVAVPPPASQAVSAASVVTPLDSQTPVATPAPPPPEASSSIISTIIQWVLLILLLLLLLFVLLLAWLLLRRLSSWIRWRVLRWRLSRGTPEQRVVGAWTWLRLRLAMRGAPLPDSASPDVAIEWALAHGDSSLATVARLTARVAFNPEGTISMPDSALAWEEALAADRRSRRL